MRDLFLKFSLLQSDLMVCGGPEGTPQSKTCLTLTAGIWVKTHDLREERVKHISWTTGRAEHSHWSRSSRYCPLIGCALLTMLAPRHAKCPQGTLMCYATNSQNAPQFSILSVWRQQHLFLGPLQMQCSTLNTGEGTVLIGGYMSQFTTEIVKEPGLVELSFTLKNPA